MGFLDQLRKTNIRRRFAKVCIMIGICFRLGLERVMLIRICMCDYNRAQSVCLHTHMYLAKVLDRA